MFVISHGQIKTLIMACAFDWFQYLTVFGSNGTGVPVFGKNPFRDTWCVLLFLRYDEYRV